MTATVGPRSSRCVFVGNIPYDATEQQMIDIFQAAGPVISFRLVFDRDTGKPKGYGFCEYAAPENAMSAMRNLNNYEFNGRAIRVDFAENESKILDRERAPPGGPAAGPAGGSATRPAPEGMASVPNMSNAPSTPDTVSALLEGMTLPQMYDVVAKMKGIIQQNGEQARQILLSNPPLAYALLQAQAMLGMINMQTVQKLLQEMQQAQAQPPPMPMPPPVIQPALAPPMTPMIAPMPGFGMVPGQFVAGVAPQLPPVGFVGGPLPPQQFAGMVPAPMGVPGGDVQAQALLLQQVMSLTPEQIDSLPPEQRGQIFQLRQHMSNLNPGLAVPMVPSMAPVRPPSMPMGPGGSPAVGGPPMPYRGY